jgi:hypothetical protein
VGGAAPSARSRSKPFLNGGIRGISGISGNNTKFRKFHSFCKLFAKSPRSQTNRLNMTKRKAPRVYSRLTHRYCKKEVSREKNLLLRPPAATNYWSNDGSSGVRDAFVEITPELDAILETILRPGDIMKIRACAGAGKSMALLQYARRHHRSRLLYVVFNCSVQKDQAKKFTRAGLTNVHVTTLDSLAFHGSRDVHDGEIAKDFNVTADDLDHEEHNQIILDSVKATLGAFALSADNEISESHVPHHGAAKARVVAAARSVWDSFATGRRKLTTTICTKIYQLNYAANDARFDIALLDEAHDCSAAQLDSVLRLRGSATVIAFDERQAINSWRGAVDEQTLAKLHATLPAATYNRSLSVSFRYGDRVAACASNVFDAFRIATTDSFLVRGNPRRNTVVVAYDDAATCATNLLNENQRVAVVGRTHVQLVSAAFEIGLRDLSKLSRLVFHSGGAFAHVDSERGTQAIFEVCALANRRASCAPLPPSTFPMINHVRGTKSPIETLRTFASVAPGSTNWSAALNLLDKFGPRTLERVATMLSSCLRVDASIGTATFITVHAAKGLSWPWVVVLDSWAVIHGDANSARECYVAITRPELGLALPHRLYSLLIH